MATETTDTTAVSQLQELLKENPELLKELDTDLIRLCKELEVI